MSDLPPINTNDPEQLQGVLDVQKKMAQHLKERLADAQRDVAELQSKLRDVDGELHVAAEATHSATDRLTDHAVRHGLVLAAGVERMQAEQATLEDELQRMERELYERDELMASLRAEGHKLEADHLMGQMELRGWEHLDSVKSREAENVMQASSERFGPGSPASAAGGRERERLDNAQRAHESKQEELRYYQENRDKLEQEAERLEEEARKQADAVAAFDASLRQKQAALAEQDQKYAREHALLIEHNNDLRRLLAEEQQHSIRIEQRALLQPQFGAEAQRVRAEVDSILDSMPRLADTLRYKGLSVYSIEVPSDETDRQLHAYLRFVLSGHAGVAAPSIVCRLGPDDYVINGRQVKIQIANRDTATVQDDLIVTQANGATSTIMDFLKATS